MLTHIIRVGDTFALLSEKYKCSITSIVSYNPGMEPETLQIGDTLYIPEDKDKFITIFCLCMQFAITWIINPSASTFRLLFSPSISKHKIKENETFSSLCQLYGCKLEDLETANSTITPTQLQIGQMVNLPRRRNKSLFFSYFCYFVRFLLSLVAQPPILTLDASSTDQIQLGETCFYFNLLKTSNMYFPFSMH
ncbi:unnamed protein product [Rotaria sp. Silwood2]|nr:unnamed protein product [Rotaria sp. Silwood2]CAF4369190.1 unnamed protein product [Rotaria sp. Silwood2]CAF4429039.1 unnamed protein product [Rotaria sp. Silwood2]CAF4703239.1 unnamed protein product [Rotaria sp. Silwood2]